MSFGARRAVLIAILGAAFILQAAIGSSIHARAFRPNIALCVMLVECLFVGANSGAVLGSLLGLLEGSYASFSLGSFLVSRSIAGFGVSLVEERVFSHNVLVAILMATLGTLAAEGAFFLFSPQPHALRWAFGTLGEAAWSALLAAPLYLGIRRLVGRPTYR